MIHSSLSNSASASKRCGIRPPAPFHSRINLQESIAAYDLQCKASFFENLPYLQRSYRDVDVGHSEVSKCINDGICDRGRSAYSRRFANPLCTERMVGRRTGVARYVAGDSPSERPLARMQNVVGGSPESGLPHRLKSVRHIQHCAIIGLARGRGCGDKVCRRWPVRDSALGKSIPAAVPSECLVHFLAEQSCALRDP